MESFIAKAVHVAISAGVTMFISAIPVAFGYGKLNQKVKNMGYDLIRHEEDDDRKFKKIEEDQKEQLLEIRKDIKSQGEVQTQILIELQGINKYMQGYNDAREESKVG